MIPKKLAATLLMTALASPMALGQIDLHSHMITDSYLEAVKAHGMEMDEGFPIPSWSSEAHLKFMDEAGIRTSVLTMPAPQPYFGDSNESAAVCRRFNEEAAALKARHPGRFLFCAALPLPDVDAAIAEAKYALEVLGADGVKLASNSYGQYLGDEELEPLMAYLNSRKAVIITHPHKPSAANDKLIAAVPLASYEYLAETTRAILNMVAHNVLVRYPDLKVVVPHCGSFLPNALPRFKGLLPVMTAQGYMQPVDVDANLSRLYYDLAGAATDDAIEALLTITEPSHVLYGSDYPYVAAPALIDAKQALQARLASHGLDPQAVFTDNAARLFGADIPTREYGERIVRLAQIEVYPDKLDEYMAFAKEVGIVSMATEPGVIGLFSMQDKSNPAMVYILEIYADTAAYQSHLQTAHFKKYKEGTADMAKELKLIDTNPLVSATMNKTAIKSGQSNPAKAAQTIQTVDFSVWPKGEPNTAYEQYFIGHSFLAPMDGGFSNVTFEPGCRNNWHIHHKQVQVLICVAGRGWYQEWGKPAVPMTPGVIIEIPEGVKHWHGAAADSWFQHLVIHINVLEGASNEWLEPVNDEQYGLVNSSK